MTPPAPHPRPGPTGPDTDALRVAFDDLLADTHGGSAAVDGQNTVSDHQVSALDSAHELLARALADLDTTR